MMRQSQLFAHPRKEAPKDEVAKNASLLLRASYINKEMAGVYSYLPLGLRVLKKIENLIREEMNKLGAQEVLLPSLQPKENWQKTGRWDTMDDLYKIRDSSDRELALGPTHEEVVTPLIGQFLNSYQDFPLAVYQFQNKFRMEKRAKSGLLRGREFMMKDLYSFHRDEADLNPFYERVITAYQNIFNAVGLGEKTYLTLASGGAFSEEFSHEFQTITESGEDTVHLCETCKLAINDEIFDKQKNCPKCGSNKLETKKSIEVGNIFKLGTKYTDAFTVNYKNETGETKRPIMGCYGLGLGRLMGTVAEVLSDENGLVWPQNIASHDLHLIELGVQNPALLESLEKAGVEILLDDRDKRAGEKFAEADLLGLPWRLVISEKSNDGHWELKNRRSGEILTLKDASEILRTIQK
ncbi:MAG: aminoacyl--tRNA ligase-related protein [Patescibacteria group bacterium]